MITGASKLVLCIIKFQYFYLFKVQDESDQDRNAEKVREFFKKLAGDDMEVDWMELKEILDFAMRKGMIIPIIYLEFLHFKTVQS